MKKLFLIVSDFGTNMSKKNIQAYASSTAFFVFLSLIPMLMLLCALIPYTPLTEEVILNAVTDIAPENMEPLLTGMIDEVYAKSVGVISITALVTLWSAGQGMLAMMRGLNAINDVEENRNYILLRCVACLYTILILILMILSLIITVFGNTLVSMLEGQIPETAYFFDMLMHFRTPFTWLILTLFISVMYMYVPGGKYNFRMQLPGAAIASIGWSVITFFFSIYVDEFNGFSTYGSLTTIIVLLLWLYACMYLVMIGAYLNRYFKPVFQLFASRRKKDKALDKMEKRV